VTKRRRNGLQTASCEDVRESLSARFDGEHPPVMEDVAAAHVAGCPVCQAFQESLAPLRRQIRLRASRSAPEGFAQLLTLPGSGDRKAPTGPLRRRLRSLSISSWLRAAQWAGAVVPAGIAIPALVLGVFGHLHIVPSHVLTPCTASFTMIHHRKWR
jgi:predicted anti-sigma-YlaC factor YlaD